MKSSKNWWESIIHDGRIIPSLDFRHINLLFSSRDASNTDPPPTDEFNYKVLNSQTGILSSTVAMLNLRTPSGPIVGRLILAD